MLKFQWNYENIGRMKTINSYPLDQQQPASSQTAYSICNKYSENYLIIQQ